MRPADTIDPAPGGRVAPMVPWMALGCIGSVGLALVGTRLGAVADPGHPQWWFGLGAGPASGAFRLSFYLSAALLVAGWAGVGTVARRGGLSVRRAWLLLGLWGIPLFLGPPLFSRDVYSYIAQGLVAHHGFDPYSVSPSALGNGPLLSSVASVWRLTAAPYGPLFVSASRGVAAVSGHSLIAQVLAFRLLELGGVVLVMVSLPRLARHLGTDPGMALWLGALSPLALFSYVASGHNDAVMIGLLLAGVALAVEGRLVGGLVLCALAAMIKLPAAAAIVFLAVPAVSAARGRRRWLVLGESILVPALTVVVVTTLSGFGWTWLGTRALRIPTELRVLSTPAVSLGVFVAHALRLVGIPLDQHAVVSVTQFLCGAAAVVGVLWLATNAHRVDVVRLLGISLVLIVLGGPTLWPWYLLWGLSLLAATPAQRSTALAVVAGAAMLVVGPSGSPMLDSNWYVVVALGMAGGAAWLLRHGRWRSVALGTAT